MNYIIFGGSGFIGTHLIHLLKAECATSHDSIYVYDIVMPGEEGVVPGIVEKNEGVIYVRGDVRKEIALSFTPTEQDVIFNLAAVHRTPGHADEEYFETNIRGAENVTAFAALHNIKKILFTSSIAPYGAGEALKKETTLPMPTSAYGISKLVAEKIHEKWQAADPTRELTMVRPGVVYGKGEHGNFTRLYWGMRKHYFVYTGRKDTIKACIYVKELVRFFKHRMVDNSFAGVDLYNCTFEPAYTIEQICTEMQKATNMKSYVPMIPAWMLMLAANILGPIGGKKVGIHPARVKKLMVSTNVCGKKTVDHYKFHYTFAESLQDWYKDCGGRGAGVSPVAKLSEVTVMAEPNAPIRIAQMMTYMNNGGVEMVVMNYYRHIDRSKVQFDFFAFDVSEIPQREEIEALGGRVFTVPTYKRPVAYIRAVLKIFKQNQYQIVHSHMNTLSVFSLCAAKLAGVPVRIAHNHSTAAKGEGFKNIIKYLLRPFAKIFPTHLAACSQYSGEWIFGKKADFKVVNNAIDLPYFMFNQEVRDTVRANLGLQDKFVVGHVGRFCFQKNHTFLIDVFAEVVKKNKNAVLLLIGDGELEEETKAQAHQLGLHRNVKFMGVRSDVNDLMQAMDVFLLPSRYEGLPVVGVEAQVSDLPCVLSNAMTAETKVLDTATFLSLNDAPAIWADKVLSFENYLRTDASETLKARGYDIWHEAELLCGYYLALAGYQQAMPEKQESAVG